MTAENLWGPVAADQWRATPCISGCAATEADVQAGRAAFFVPGDSLPAAVPLPCCARQSLEGGGTQRVVVIQAEVAPYGIVVGVRPLEGGNGVCTLDELELLPSGFSPSNDV